MRAEEAERASQGCSGSQAREERWASWMRAAMSGDAGAYREFLELVAPAVRLLVRRAGGESRLRSSGQISANDKWRPAGFAVFAA